MEEEMEILCQSLGISPFLGRILVNRGIRTPSQARRFLEPRLEDLHNPFLFSEMRDACQRVRRAISDGEEILIFGDWDVDGITSMAILIRLLRALKGKVIYYIPGDFLYGLEMEAISEAKEKGVGLIISVDCGITDIEEINYARSLGIDVVVLDHHESRDGQRPDAIAVVNPKTDPAYPWDGLSGSGVAFKFGQALLASYDHEDLAQDLAHPRMEYYFRQYLDLACLGTLADSMPLIEENRILTRYGLRHLSNTAKVGLKVLLHSLGLLGSDIFENEVNFKLSPILNAAGRMNQNHLGIELLTIKKKDEATQIANELLSLNRMRQKRVEMDTVLAIEYVEREIDLGTEKILVVPLHERELGITGIVANRLVERYTLPVIVFAGKGREAIGSARAPQGIDIISILAECRSLYLDFGGHKQAAGLRLRWEDIQRFRRCINEVAGQFDCPPKRARVDARVDQDEITQGLLMDIERLRPFGEANPSPLLLLEEIRPMEIETMGDGGRHLKFIIASRDVRLEVIGWGKGDLSPSSLSEASLLGRIEKEIWEGEERIRFFIEEILPKR